MEDLENVEQAVRDLKARIEVAQRNRTRAEYEKDSAQAVYDKASARLRDEFGVSSVEEAKELLVSMESELRKAVDEVKLALERASA